MRHEKIDAAGELSAKMSTDNKAQRAWGQSCGL